MLVFHSWCARFSYLGEQPILMKAIGGRFTDDLRYVPTLALRIGLDIPSQGGIIDSAGAAPVS